MNQHGSDKGKTPRLVDEAPDFSRGWNYRSPVSHPDSSRLEVESGRVRDDRSASVPGLAVVRVARYCVSQKRGVLKFTLAHKLRVEAMGQPLESLIQR